MEDIFESTLRLKDFIHEGNAQLVKISDKIEISGFSPYIMAHYHGLDKDYKDITIEQNRNYIFDPEVFHTVRKLKDSSFIKLSDLSVNKIDTKAYWSFIHQHFPFCDVSSYYRTTNLETYFAVKGIHYEKIVEKLGAHMFRGKKILEIGPGYGYLPKMFKEHDIQVDYYCADIVRRFDHDNFIEVSGYSLDNIRDKFDVVIMQDVIQHLGTEIFKEYTKQIKENLLVKNGVLIIATEVHHLEDYSSFFFGQCYDMLGYRNMEKYLIVDLELNVEAIPFELVDGTPSRSVILLCENM